jgi:DNA end-binding protein Ku
MARAIWSGTVSFGLVSIPVRLFNATSPKDVRFHQFDRESGRRIRYRRVTESASDWELPEGPVGATREEAGLDVDDGEGRPAPSHAEPREMPDQRETSPSGEAVVSYEDVIKGYEVDRDRFVMVSPEELEALRPEQSRTIEIEHFVNLQDIDPVHFEKSYYLAPQRGVGAEKPYGLLLAAMERSGRVGVARFVLRSKEYLAAIRPVRGMLGLETMFFDDEVRTSEEIDNVPVAIEPAPRELQVAMRLIELLVTEWDPARYQDTYRQRVMELIEGKLEAEDVHVPEPEPRASSGIPDLMAALKASVEAARKHVSEPASPTRSGTNAKPRRRRTG